MVDLGASYHLYAQREGVAWHLSNRSVCPFDGLLVLAGGQMRHCRPAATL
jgi:hypothetical protein